MKLFLIGLVLLQRWWFMWQYPLSAEDAYISFHAAVDPGWMKSTTSPIYAMFLGVWDPPTVSRILALAGDVMACWSVLSVASLEGGVLFCLFWVTPFMTGSAISGLETHLAACALVAGLAWPRIYVLGCLRPDTIAMSIMASGKRWMGPAIGAGVFVAAALILAGGLPQTVGSKLSVYGVHWFKGWYWWHSEGLGWLELALVAGGVWASLGTKQWRYFLTALAPICLHWVLGTPNFWWYAVPSAAMLAALYCREAGRKALILGVIAVLLCWGQQRERLTSRLEAERALWDTGKKISEHYEAGTIMLEPAGIIPYLNPGLRVVDEIGLVDPWMAKRRTQGPGWFTDAVAKYHPDLVLVRVRNLADGGSFSGAGAPYRNSQERFGFINGHRLLGIGPAWGQGDYEVQLRAHVLAVLSPKTANSPKSAK